MSSLSQAPENQSADARSSLAPWPPPKRPSLGTALKRYPIILLLPVAVLVAAGITLGVRRHPVYSASTQLNVGVNNANSQATPGYVEASQQLASSYARQAVSKQIASIVAANTNLRETEVASRITAPAVPDSPTFYINATGSTARKAVGLSVAAAEALRRNVDAAKRNTGAGTMLAQYRKLQQQANTLSQTAGRLNGQLIAQRSSVANGGSSVLTTTATTTSPDGTLSTTTRTTPPVTPQQVANAKLAAQVAQLKAQTQSERYTTAAGQSNDSNLQIITPAQHASSDRTTYIERYGVVGLVAGLVIGAVLAFLFARARFRWIHRRSATT